MLFFFFFPKDDILCCVYNTFQQIKCCLFSYCVSYCVIVIVLTIYHVENNFISFHTLRAGIGQNLSWISIVSHSSRFFWTICLTVQGHSEMLHPIVFLNLCGIVRRDSLSVYSTMRVWIDACGQPVSPSSHTEVLSWWQTDLFSNVTMQILFFAHFVIFVYKLSRGKWFSLSVLLY